MVYIYTRYIYIYLFFENVSDIREKCSRFSYRVGHACLVTNFVPDARARTSTCVALRGITRKCVRVTAINAVNAVQGMHGGDSFYWG